MNLNNPNIISVIISDSNVSLIISIISLLISLATFLYNFFINKKNLKINFSEKHFDFYKDDEVFVLSVGCELLNMSKNPINISSIKLEFNDLSLQAITKPIGLKGNGFTLFGEIVKYEDKSISLPMRLECYDSFETYLVFTCPHDQLPNFDNIPAKIVFNTSRRQSKKRVFITNQS